MRAWPEAAEFSPNSLWTTRLQRRLGLMDQLEADFADRAEELESFPGSLITEKSFGKKFRKILLRKLGDLRSRHHGDICKRGIDVDNSAVAGVEQKHFDG